MLIGISGKMGSGKDTVGKIIQYLLYMSEEVKGRYYPYDVFIDELETVNFHGSVNYEIKKFADKLKDFVCMLIGCTREQLEDQEFKNKELPEEWWYYKPGVTMYSYLEFKQYEDQDEGIAIYSEDLIKTTPRLLLQIIGTDCIRDRVHPNAWVNALFADYNPRFSGLDIMDFSEEPSKVRQIHRTEESYWIITDMRFPNEMEAVKNRGGITIRVNRPYTTVAGDNGIPATFNHAQFHPSETALDNAEFDYTIENNSSIEDLIHTVSLILTKEKII